jgi:hypothetical protein
MAVGLTDNLANLDQIPGWRSGSWGYHGDDGGVRDGNNTNYNYGPKYTAGDMIGCGILPAAGRVYFTKNGVFLGMSIIDSHLSLPPDMDTHD